MPVCRIFKERLPDGNIIKRTAGGKSNYSLLVVELKFKTKAYGRVGYMLGRVNMGEGKERMKAGELGRETRHGAYHNRIAELWRRHISGVYVE